ncbi:MAG: hypothetical protein AB7N76_02245 [Planctomycetota bacterium]
MRAAPSRGALAAALALCALGCPQVEGDGGAPPAAAAPVASRSVGGIPLRPDMIPREASGPAPAALAGPVRRVWTGLRYPRALARSPEGALYAIDKSGWLRSYAADGRPLRETRLPEIELGTPSAMAWHPAGKLLVADSHYGRVLVYSAGLELEAAWGHLGHEAGGFLLVTGIAASADGRVFVSDQGDDVARIQVFGLEGRLQYAIGRWGSAQGELKRPMNLSVRGQELAVADSLNHRVQVFHLDGAPLRVLGGLGESLGELKYPYGVSWDGEGRLWVADFGNHRLQLLDRHGRCLRYFQGKGRAVGGLGYPWTVLWGGGRLFTTDGAYDRCYELRPEALPSP